VIHGAGTYWFANGSKYTGMFCFGQRNGYGEYFDQEQNYTLIGFSENGVPVGTQKFI
jgi:hypothetical protein